MHARDHVPSALTALPDERLTRLAQSLAHRAARDRRNGRAASAAWRDTLRVIVLHERARRAGHVQPLRDADDRLEAAARSLSERDLVVLITEQRLEILDIEGYCGAPAILVSLSILAELERAMRVARAGTNAIARRVIV